MTPAGGPRARTALACLALLLAAASAFAAASKAPATTTPAASSKPAAAPAVAPAKAEAPAPGLERYAGTWRLDVTASDFGKRGRVPRSREDRIQSEGPWFSVRSSSIRGEGDTLLLEYRYRTDGDAVNMMRGQEIRTRGRREGATVWFASEAQFLMVKLQVNEHWSLSSDGATLMQERTSKSPLGEEIQRLEFRRVP